MFAVSVAQKAQALAGAFVATADAHVVQVAQAKAMHRKAAAADGTGNFLHGVIVGAPAGPQCDYTRCSASQWAYQTDGTLGNFRHGLKLAVSRDTLPAISCYEL